MKNYRIVTAYDKFRVQVWCRRFIRKSCWKFVHSKVADDDQGPVEFCSLVDAKKFVQKRTQTKSDWKPINPIL